jgi:hypothetical protein
MTMLESMAMINTNDKYTENAIRKLDWPMDKIGNGYEKEK